MATSNTQSVSFDYAASLFDLQSDEETVISSNSSASNIDLHQLDRQDSSLSTNTCQEVDWYFMNLAILYSKKRKNVKHQAGACIVDSSRRVVGIGNYKSTKKIALMSLFKETPACNDYLNHAEVNAIHKRKVMSLEDCTIYVTSFPCIECSKLIAQSGIRRLVYIEDHCCQILTQEQVLAAQVLLGLAKVEYTKLE